VSAQFFGQSLAQQTIGGKRDRFDLAKTGRPFSLLGVRMWPRSLSAPGISTIEAGLLEKLDAHLA
jgi:hypothetical protein